MQSIDLQTSEGRHPSATGWCYRGSLDVERSPSTEACSGRLIYMPHNEPTRSIKTAPERESYLDADEMPRVDPAAAFRSELSRPLRSKPLLPGLSAGEVPLKYVTISSKALDIITTAELRKNFSPRWQSSDKEISRSASSSPRPTQITFQSPWGSYCRTRIVLLVIEWHFISHRPNPHMVTGRGCREYGHAATL